MYFFHLPSYVSSFSFPPLFPDEGEIILWVGIYLIDLPALVGKFGWSSVALSISPLFITVLLVAQALGMLAPTLELAKNKYATFPAYETYVNETPLFVPSFWRF